MIQTSGRVRFLTYLTQEEKLACTHCTVTEAYWRLQENKKFPLITTVPLIMQNFDFFDEVNPMMDD